MRRFFFAGLLVTAAIAGGPARAENAPAPVATGSATPAADPSAQSDVQQAVTIADLDKMLAPLVGDGDQAARRAAVKTVLELGPDATNAIAKELAVLRNNKSGAVFAALKMVRDTHRGQHGEYDLLDALLGLEKSDGAGVKTATTTVALLRALAHIGTKQAILTMLGVADDHVGALRPEIARLLHDLGDRSIPALLLARKDPSPDVRKFVHAELEAFGKKTPGDAVQTKSNQVLADVLRAFAETHEIDAVPVILSFVSSDRAEVQSAARDAILRFGVDAVWKVREAYTNLTGKSPPDGASPQDVARELFAAYDRVRLREVYELLDSGKKLETEGKIADAVAVYDKVLALQPMLERRAETVSGYVALAQSKEDSDPEAARAMFKKALRIDPEGPHAAQIKGELYYLEGKSLEGRGIADAETFRRALAADPGHVKARAELDRLDSESVDHRARMQRYAGAGVIAFVAMSILVLFGGRRRKIAPVRRVS